MQGHRHTVTSADGTRIGLLTAGTGPALLLVHGGMGRLERWEPLWGLLTGHWQVTAMDRRGRGSSGDTEPYLLGKEYDDVAAVATSLADDVGRSADVFAHSYGALCALGAAAGGVTAPVLLLLGEASPAWAADLTHALSAALPQATLAVLPGSGHEAVDAAPGLIYRELAQFLT